MSNCSRYFCHFSQLSILGLLLTVNSLIVPLDAADFESISYDGFISEIAINSNQFFLLATGQKSCSEWNEVATEAMAELVEDVTFFCTEDEKLISLFEGSTNSLVLAKSSQTMIYSGSHDTGALTHWLLSAVRARTQSFTDDTFEHLTQASTGATTGDWLVAFHSASRCPISSTLLSSTAVPLVGKVNVADVNTDDSPKLVKRFSLAQCQTVILFRHGRMYIYPDDKPLVPATLASFTTNWFKDLHSVKVPTEPTPFDLVTDSIVAWLKSESTDGSWAPLLMRLGAAVGTVLIVVALLFCCRSKPKVKQS